MLQKFIHSININTSDLKDIYRNIQSQILLNDITLKILLFEQHKPL